MKKMLILAAAGLAASTASAQVLYTNGGVAELKTGTTTRAGNVIGVAGEWAEVGDDGANLAINSAGNNCVQGTFRCADDFTVPTGETWTVTGVELYFYQTGAVAPSINNVTVAVHNQDPANGNPPAFGNQTTNVFASVAFSDAYRIFNTFANGGCAASAPSGTNRRIQVVQTNVNFNLTAGTYWLDWAAAGSVASGPWVPGLQVKPLGTGITKPGWNSQQQSAGLFGPTQNNLRDGTAGCIFGVITFDPIEFPFTIKGTKTGGCRPDLTTGAVPGQPGYGTPNGVLNNDDFFYYLAQFSAGNLAVADMTTGAIPGQPGYGVPNGVLNNDDFFYFLAIFAAGC
jgi:hypothetical protein